MNSDKILSVAIPAYQVEKYIAHTLDSLLRPAILEDIEILVINDGSSDNTLKIALQYEKDFPNVIRVISKANGGHGSAINVGLKESKGKYFKIIDGDDWVDEEGFLLLVSKLKETNCDMIINQYLKLNSSTLEKTLVTYKEKRNLILDFNSMNRRSMRYFMHSITYRTQLLKRNEIRIDENLFYVDMEYILYPIPYVKNVVFWDFPVYIYQTFSEHQSMNIVNIQKRREQHKAVIFHLIDFYLYIKGDLSKPKEIYIKKNIAMMAMLQYKIILSLPNMNEGKRELFEFDKELKEKSIDVYNNCFGFKMWALRHFGRSFYPLFSYMLQKTRFF